MYTFLPIIHHELASMMLTEPPAAIVEPARIATPSWPAPVSEKEVVYEGKYCVVRVAQGFSRQAFTDTPQAAPSTRPAANMGEARLLDMNGQDWPAPARPAAVELKLPRRSTPRPVEAESLTC